MSKDSLKAALEPCAHCKAPGYLISGRKSGTFKVKCTGCEIQTKPSLYQDEVVSAWNRRASTDAAPVAGESGIVAKIIAAIEAESEKHWKDDYILDGKDCIDIIRETVAAQPPAAEPVDEDGWRRVDIRQNIIRQLGDYPHADCVILPGPDWDIVLEALATGNGGEGRS